ncbi:Cytochrome P450 3A2 [Orchesella cincta]|uniref:Cytochrome P450 3A2 n=1 Tax=Orchesella cincta TaxID=48709 RepID=A0A1D2MEZ8_ORCCI|nr:Cytochrome P450 3A2 [Orchesella cincta]
MWFALISVIVIGLLLYKLLGPSNTSNYWAQYGIRQLDGSPAASQKEILTGVKDVTHRDTYAYQQLGENEQFCGMIESHLKVIFIKDLELAKKILIKDFDHFVDRRNFFVVSKNSVLNKLLSSLTGQEWKNTRAAVSPAFTTGKIRRYMESFNSIGKDWVNMIKEKADNDSKTAKVNVLPTVSQFTTDVIAQGVFGFDAGTVRNPNSSFARMANRLGNMNQWKVSLSLHFPKFFQFFGIDIIDMEAFRFFQTIVSQGLQARLGGDTEKRNDFLQMMVEVKKGELKADGNDELSSFEKDAEIKNENKQFVLTDDIINAQSVTFFFAGFSTTGNFLAFALYSLAAYPDIQEKLREEVRKIVKKDGTFNYDDVSQLVYLDMVCCEVLRKFPAGLRVERMCTKDYKEPESGMFVPKGSLVVIPIKSIHNDKRYYEKPDEFYPEHFSPENKAKRNPYAYLAFGQGPRNCIGMRLALVQSKAAIAHVLHNFRIEPSETTKIPMEGKIGSLQYLPPDDLELKFTVL